MDSIRLAGPFYSKTKNTGQIYFHQEDIKLIQKNKGTCKASPNFTFTLRKWIQNNSNWW